jgi:hypothetical protein
LHRALAQAAAFQRSTGLRQAQHEERVRNHPADDARHKPRTGRPPTFLFPDRAVATLLHLRLGLSDDTLTRLLQTSPAKGCLGGAAELECVG